MGLLRAIAIFLFLCIFLPVAFQDDAKCEHNVTPPDGLPPVRSFKINLDEPPEERWREVAKNRSTEIRHLMDKFKQFVLSWGNSTQEVIDFVDHDFVKLGNSFPKDFMKEMVCISKNSNLNLGEVILFNIFYEFFSLCTSVIAVNPSGEMFHARNLDFGLFLGWDIKNNTWTITEALRPLVVNLDFQRGGQTLFKSVSFAGYIGVLTGVHPGQFSFTLNERYNLNGGYIGIFDWLRGEHDQRWTTFLTRRLMEQATTYEDAKRILIEAKLVAPVYFILGGTNSTQASVITRDRNGAVDVWEMQSIKQHPWFILQTNYDHWNMPLPVDDRRSVADRCMSNMTQKGVSLQGIYNVLSTQPVLNKYPTSVPCPGDGSLYHILVKRTAP